MKLFGIKIAFPFTGTGNTREKANGVFADVLFFLFVALVLVVRTLVYFKLNLHYIDSDQPLLWIGAKDYSEGLFYEPRYYGQAYSTLMESLFAVPFIWCKMPVYKAVPLATHIIFLFPFLFTAFYLYANKLKWNAVLVLALLLCLPNAFDFLSSLPRGFVTGLFFTGFFVVNLLHPQRLSLVFVNSVLALLGYYVNPNSLLVSIPFLFYILLHNYKNKRYYLLTFFSLLSFIPFYFLFDWFYAKHPEYITHKLVSTFDLEYFSTNISHLDLAFQHVTFFVENNCIPLLISFLAMGVYLFLKNKKAFFAFVFFTGFILVSLSASKTTDGSTWLYFSYSRMYLGIPLMLVLFLCTTRININGFYKSIFIIPLLFTCYKFKTIDKSVVDLVKVNTWEAVHVMTLKDALGATAYYKEICEKHKVKTLVISGGFWLNSVLDYAGPAIYPDFPETFDTREERRYWARNGNAGKVYKNFVFLSNKSGFNNTLSETSGFKIKDLDGWGMFLITDNRLTKAEFVSLANKIELGR